MFGCVFATELMAQQYKPAENPLFTPWARDVGPENAWPQYPRPQMVRSEWLNLNGLWDYRLEPLEFTPVQGLIKTKTMTDGKIPRTWQGKILVPFAIDSALSGVKHVLQPTERLWYKRRFAIPAGWQGKRILLHFQASDWETSVYVNGRRIGQHRGGYDPFTFDITDHIKDGDNELAVCAWDATEQQCQAIGKQIMPENRKGFRYQPTGGIWRTVWLEPVPETYIRSIKLTPRIDKKWLDIQVEGNNLSDCYLQASVYMDSKWLSRAIVEPDIQHPKGHFTVTVPELRLWSPDDPFLYDVKIAVIKKKEGFNAGPSDDLTGSEVLDEIRSYFGMRKVEIRKADDGFVRIHLNDEPIFQFGPLDQGYWPDGILTPPSDEAIKFDLEYLKQIGCNMVRVHIKTHPERWYYWADKLGLLIWQDMICMPKYGQTVDEAAAAQWQKEFAAMIDWLYNHPSIIQWVVFNEGWSQHDTLRYTEWVKLLDSSRLVTNASGWLDANCGDILDIHDYTFYPGIATQETADGRAVLLGEAGGHNLAIPGHTWYGKPEPEDRYDYTSEMGRMTFSSPEKMLEGYSLWLDSLCCLNRGAGCNAAVYTQITDVEHELNGWLTYDRNISKVAPERLLQLHKKLYDPPELIPILPAGQSWKYTESSLVKPRKSNRSGEADFNGTWTRPDFDDSSWKKGVGGFGGKQLSDVSSKTTVSAKVVYLRSDFELETIPQKPILCVTGREDCQIFVNGRLLRRIRMNARSEQQQKISYIPVRTDELRHFKRGRNVLAVAVTNAIEEAGFDVSLFNMADGSATKSSDYLPVDRQDTVPAPFFVDPHYQGSCDPEIVFNAQRKEWWIFYTARRSTKQNTWMGCPIGVAASKNLKDWRFLGYCKFDGTGGEPDSPDTFWAPGIIRDGDTYHMFVTYKSGTDTTAGSWGGPGTIVHYEAPAGDLINGWKKVADLHGPEIDTLDACLHRVGNLWHLWHKGKDKKGTQLFHWTSRDLYQWKKLGADKGDMFNQTVTGFRFEEAPYVFSWKGKYWLITDAHQGLPVYSSDDARNWTYRGAILLEPGTRKLDMSRARHCSIGVISGRAFIFYHVEPWRDYDGKIQSQPTSNRRAVLQMAELKYEDGRLTCDRNKPVIPPERPVPGSAVGL